MQKKTVIPGEGISIPMLDLKGQYDEIKQEAKEVLKEILESGQFVLGKHVKAFEKEVAEYHGVKYAASLASGTDALHMSLRALDIHEGDEVITTPFTFIASAEAIAYVGAKPVFADIDSRTYNIDPEKIKEKITAKTRAIIPVHLFGRPADMDDIMEIANKNSLKVIEDCAQSFGAKYKGSSTGSIGDTGCFSFYPSKNLGAFGDGGIMITNNKGIYEKVMLLRNHGSKGSYKHDFIGYNSRLDEIQAAILRLKLKHIDRYNNNRQKLAHFYTSILNKSGDSGIQCPYAEKDMSAVYHQYTIRYPKRYEIQNALKDNLVSSVVYYPLPLHLQKAFKYLGYKEGDFPQSESAAKEVLSLPIYPELEHEKVKYIAELILNAVKG